MSFILAVVLGDGDSDASEGGGLAPEDPDQDQEMHTASCRQANIICMLYF